MSIRQRLGKRLEALEQQGRGKIEFLIVTTTDEWDGNLYWSRDSKNSIIDPTNPPDGSTIYTQADIDKFGDSPTRQVIIFHYYKSKV